MSKDPDLSLEFPLFVPATRLERCAKASNSGASSIIIDLEDAVAPDEKSGAREALVKQGAIASNVPCYIRINAYGTPWYEADIAAALAIGAQGIVLPKAQCPTNVQNLRQQLPEGIAMFGLIETALGMGAVRTLAPMFDRLLFGSLDYAADIGCAHTDTALAAARSEIILAARMVEKPGPCDGVSTNTKDPQLIEAEARRGAEHGFRGKLLIHPMQVAPALNAYMPEPDEVDWAQRVLKAAASGSVVVLDGAMVDAPVVAKAQQVLKMVHDAASRQ